LSQGRRIGNQKINQRANGRQASGALNHWAVEGCEPIRVSRALLQHNAIEFHRLKKLSRGLTSAALPTLKSIFVARQSLPFTKMSNPDLPFDDDVQTGSHRS